MYPPPPLAMVPPFWAGNLLQPLCTLCLVTGPAALWKGEQQVSNLLQAWSGLTKRLWSHPQPTTQSCIWMQWLGQWGWAVVFGGTACKAGCCCFTLLYHLVHPAEPPV